MAILVDPPRWPAHGTLWSHLVSDTSYDELHAFAKRLGLPRRGFDLDHYDIAAARHGEAIELGAIAVSGKDVVHRLRDAGLRVRQTDRDTVTPIRRREYLLEEWAALGFGIGIAAADPRHDAWQRLGIALLTRWNEPHRRYHDERHLEDVLLALDQFGTRGERISSDALLAAWFHDAVYAGTTSDESDSAKLAQESLAAFGLDPEQVNRVHELIIATTPGRDIRDPAPALAQLLDADLAIFASPPHRYAEYAAAVREEYAHVPEADFAIARAQILNAYLDQPTIYRTSAAQQLWEARARANVAAEIDRLQAAQP